MSEDTVEVVNEDSQVEGEQPNEASQGEDFESEARIYGWVPKEEFRDDPNKWVDAQRFVERGREINPILRKNNQILLDKHASLIKELDEIKGTVKEFKKYHEEVEKRSYEKALKELKDAKKEAISLGDGERVIELDDQIDNLKENRPQPQQTYQQKEQEENIPPELIEWQNQNTWYGTDKEMTAVTNALGQIVSSELGLTGKAWLDEVTNRVKKRFPEKFKSRVSEASVEGGSSSGITRAGGKGYKDLPAEAKAACDRFVKQGLVTKEQYIKDYFSEE